METSIYQGRISDLKIDQVYDIHFPTKYTHSFKINDKEFQFEALRDLYISNTHYLIVRADKDGNVIALYDAINDEKHGKKWQQLKKLKPKKIQPLFHYAEGVVEQKQFISERLYNSQRKYAGRLKYYKIKINDDTFNIGEREGKRITPRDKIAFLHPENKKGMTVFHNFTNGENTLSVFPINIVTYSLLLLCSIVGALLIRSSSDKALQVTIGIVCGIFFLASALYLWDAIALRLFEKKRMKELMLYINKKS